MARHFGFCYGVENAIEIAFKTVDENPGKRIFLLSEMIHNPQVNADLKQSGVDFIMNTKGEMLKNWDEISADDIVIIPAFGTTTDTEALLRDKGINPLQYNTTCPFVERVWNKAEQIGKGEYTVVIHGKPEHEETRATFSHSAIYAKSIVIKNMQEAEYLAKFILGEISIDDASAYFKGRCSANFNFEHDLKKIGVVNQTTMLAEETQGIADYLKQVMLQQYGAENIKEVFADTRDTLCYATNDNQTAVKGMLEHSADLAIVIGGYNSSNTSHLVELCEEKLPTYYIKDEQALLDNNRIRHYNFHTHEELVSENIFPTHGATIMITSGASCPDAIVERVIDKLAALYGESKAKSLVIDAWALA